MFNRFGFHFMVLAYLLLVTYLCQQMHSAFFDSGLEVATLGIFAGLPAIVPLFLTHAQQT